MPYFSLGFPSWELGGSVLQQVLVLDSFRMFKLLGERCFGSVN